jgi:hypothetical protein
MNSAPLTCERNSRRTRPESGNSMRRPRGPTALGGRVDADDLAGSMLPKTCFKAWDDSSCQGMGRCIQGFVFGVWSFRVLKGIPGVL